ncbi:hypothetical protein XAUB_28570 [Xanthomonas citri pv. aurantifolii str. ICPB 11122]|nr:hypothetical protein XAUB_28570 [Xanthomonas citri pv. aurantifolii str. ICPB 11122]
MPALGQVDVVVRVVEHAPVRALDAVCAMPYAHVLRQLALAETPRHIAQAAIWIGQRVVLVDSLLEAINVIGHELAAVACAHEREQLDQIGAVLRRIGQLHRIPARIALHGQGRVLAAHCTHEYLRAFAVIEPEHARAGLVGHRNERGQQGCLTPTGVRCERQMTGDHPFHFAMEVEVVGRAALCLERHDGRPPQVAVDLADCEVVQRGEAGEIARLDLAAPAHEVLRLAGKLRPKERLHREPLAHRLDAEIHERFLE